MTDPVLIISSFLILIFGTVIGYLVATFRSKSIHNVLKERNEQLNNQYQDYKTQIQEQVFQLKEQGKEEKEAVNKQFLDACREREEIRSKKDLLSTQLTERNSEYRNLQIKLEEQKGELEKLQEKFSKEFENLANKILDQKSEKFTSINKDNIEQILSPLQEKIKIFEEKVEKNSNDFIERHAQLGEKLQHLHEQNIKISEEANNLTKALKGDSQKQGNWGEMILESVLEKSGLRKDLEYFTQQSFTSEEGRRVRPDVVVHLPGDKKLIVDSKVSLVDYDNFCSEEDADVRDKYLKKHLISIQKHVENLSSKKYHQLYDTASPEFVMLFIPIESAFALASQKQPSLYSDAFEKDVILVTPTTLLAVLKTIESMWQNEKQKQNAIDIATQAGRLYDAFTNLTEELLKVERQMGVAQNSFDGVMKKLTGKGNLITRVERLKELGARASKQINPNLVARAYSSDEDDDN